MESFAKFMILVYPVGIPVLYLYLLYRGREALHDEALREEVLEGDGAAVGAKGTVGRLREQASNAPTDKIRMTKMLWQSYEERCWWWEVIECVRRLALTGALVFVAPDSVSQVAWAIVVSQMTLLLNFYFTPYEETEDDIVANLAGVVVSVFLF